MQELFNKYLKGQCTPEELESLMAYFEHPKNELLLKQLIMMELGKTDENSVAPANLDARLANIQQRLQEHITVSEPKTAFWQKWKGVTAAAVILIAGTAVLYLKQEKKPTVEITATTSHIRPGKNTATLTLADGTRIALKNAGAGELAKQGNISISQTADGQIIYHSKANALSSGTIAYNQLSTANGEQYTIVLPDASIVTLNAASSIKYPASFAGLNERKIELTGEAYFIVKHDDKHPFKVIASGLKIEDVGTEFNINSYIDEGNIKATLISGAANVSSKNNDSFLLTPAQQAVFNGSTLNVSKVDPEVFVAWKKGTFAYKNTSLEEVMRQVSRWYNLQIIYTANDLKAKHLSGSVSRYDDVAGILNAIGYTAKVRFRLTDKQITVLPE